MNPSNHVCHTSDFGQFCVDTRHWAIPIQRSHAGPIHIAFPWLGVIFVGVVWLFLLALSGRLLVWIDKYKSMGSSVPSASGRFRHLKFATLATLFIAALTIWAVTLSAISGLPFVARLVGAILVIPAVLSLEALGFAFLELADKEVEENVALISQTQVRRLVAEFETNVEAYFRAREWCLAALVILITLLVEFPQYAVPFVGTFSGWIPRTTMTIVLATLAVIWIAQAPGKELGRIYPVSFLSLPFLPQSAHSAVKKIMRLAESLSLNEPSDLAAVCIRKVLRLSEEEAISPGQVRIFSELVKRYGYGDCEVNEEFVISDDGSVKFEQIEWVYLSTDVNPYHRVLTSDAPFTAISKVEYQVWAVPQITLLAPDIQTWINQKGRRFPAYALADPPKVVFSDDRKKATIDIDFEPNVRLSGEGIVIRVETAGEMSATAFRSPDRPGDDYWTRGLSKPCFRATTTIRFEELAKPARFHQVDCFAQGFDKSRQTAEDKRYRRWGGGG